MRKQTYDWFNAMDGLNLWQHYGRTVFRMKQNNGNYTFNK